MTKILLLTIFLTRYRSFLSSQLIEVSEILKFGIDDCVIKILKTIEIEIISVIILFNMERL